jgi:hypothetical protein
MIKSVMQYQRLHCAFYSLTFSIFVWEQASPVLFLSVVVIELENKSAVTGSPISELELELKLWKPTIDRFMTFPPQGLYPKHKIQ